MALRLVAPAAVRSGERFRVSVVADASVPVGRYTVALSFDPSMLRAVSASPGDFMEQGSALAKFTHSGSAGRGELVFGAEQDGGAGVEGTGSLAVMEFEANSPGIASIAFTSVEAFQGNGEVVRARPEERRLLMINN